MDKSIEIKREYKDMVKKYSPNSSIVKNCIVAFLVGGAICTLGEGIIYAFRYYGYTRQDASGMATVILVILSALLTGIGVYDDIGKMAGAGSIIPITGFANSIVAPAMEYKKEGFVMGVGAKMFTVAGPVIVYGVISSIVVGLIYYFVR